MKKIAMFMCAALLGAAAVHAVPAKRIWRTFTQPDGSKVELMQAGDEFSHYFLTRSGDYVLRDNDGVFKYASVDAKGELSTLDLLVSSRSNMAGKVNKAAIEKAINARAEQNRANRKRRASTDARKAPAKVVM